GGSEAGRAPWCLIGELGGIVSVQDPSARYGTRRPAVSHF
ncbi:hypothetical protein JMJ77_0006126, partial [Colletotrichum scovillei]